MNSIDDIFSDFDINDFSSFDLEEKEIVEDQNEEFVPVAKELSDEIRAFRDKKKNFEATNDHETYFISVFSCKRDKEEFLKSFNLEKNATVVDGYQLANILNVEPKMPSVKLPKPL